MIIGLVPVLIGSIDGQEIEAFCAAASFRGRNILGGLLLEKDEKSPKHQRSDAETSP